MSLLKEASLAYIFDPIRNTFVDDEDKSLGNKLALSDDAQNIMDLINKQMGPGTVFPASDLPEIENPYKDFMDRNPMAQLDNVNTPDLDQTPDSILRPGETLEDFDVTFRKPNAEGGRINQRSGTNIMTLNPLFPEKDPTDFDSFKPLDVPGMAFPVGATIGGMRLKDTFFSKDDDKKDLKQSDDKNNIIPPEFNPKDPKFVENIIEQTLTLKEIRDTFEKSKQLYDQKKMSEVVEVTDKEFAQKLANFIDTNYDGRIETAVKDILGVKEKTKDVENLRQRVIRLFENRGIKRDTRAGNIAPSILNFETEKPKTSWSDFTTKVSTDSSYIKNLTKPLIKKGLIDKSLYLAQRDLEKIFNIELPDNKLGKSARNDMALQIKKLSDEGSIRKKQKGKFPYYHVGDVMRAFQLKYGEGGKKISGVVKQGTPKKYKELTSFDKSLASVIDVFQNSFESAAKTEGLTEKKPTGKQGIINKATPDHSHAEPRSTMLKFPNVFKNSNIKTFQTITLTDPIFNQEILSKGGFEAKKIKIYRILNNYIGKKVTPESREIIIEQKNKLNNINSEILKKAEEKGLEGVEETFVPIDINVPNVGEKFRSENIFGDTTGKNIMGNVNEINPSAKVYDDLSKEEKLIYRDNLINEYIDYYKDFYERAGFDEEDIMSFVDRVLEGDPAGQTLPISERKIEKAKGGGVEITPLPRLNFSEGGTDNFAAELEYYFTNPDAELPKMQTFEETLNPIVMINDLIDPRNYPFYADQLVQGGIRVGEFATRILPATGKLISDLTRKPAFKITGASGQGYVQDYDELPQGANIKGTGIFSEFLENITPTATEKKLGLDKLIEAEEQKMKDRGSTIAPKILGETLSLGVEFGSPIFPGIKLLKAYANANKLPVDNVTKELLEKEVDKVLTERGTSRRKFLQTAGASASLILAKMLGIGDDFAKTTKVAEKAVAETATGGGAPPYFFQLVEKIKKNGTKFESEFDPRVENNITYEGYNLRENLTTGEITITKSTEGGMNVGDDVIEGTLYDEAITYNPGEVVMGSDGKPIKTAVEYDETTVSPDYDGKMKDAEPGLNSIEEIIQIIGPNKIKMSELEEAGYNVNAFPDNIKNLLIDDLQKTN